jgi:hypothetical protein
VKVRFLLDENLSPRLTVALHRLDETIDVLRIGDDSAPSLQIAESEIIHFLSRSHRMLVTDNRSTIPDHLTDHYAHGGESHWGIVWIQPGTSLGEIAANLHLIWQASEAEEWLDRADWIPL